jgi:hypothetical protein
MAAGCAGSVSGAAAAAAAATAAADTVTADEVCGSQLHSCSAFFSLCSTYVQGTGVRGPGGDMANHVEVDHLEHKVCNLV